MTILTVAIKYLRGRLLASVLTTVSIASGRPGDRQHSRQPGIKEGLSPVRPTTISWSAPRAVRRSFVLAWFSAWTSRRRNMSTRFYEELKTTPMM